MEWHLNDLSLQGQFANPSAVREALEPILQFRLKRPDFRSRLFCSRAFYLQPATPTWNLQQALMALGDRDFRRLALEWFAKGGPFWDDDRAANQDDYFHFDGQDVTDQGLGEAARRLLDHISAGSLSFAISPFECTPLVVLHGLPEEPLGQIEVVNAWSVAHLDSQEPDHVTSWTEMMARARARMNLLVFSDSIPAQLAPQPFHRGIADRILQLLGVLQSIAVETGFDSSLSAAGNEIRQKHFVGEKAAFTDESDGNKRAFHDDLTFPDPTNPRASLFCSWHGKVKQGQFRIHFEWLRPRGQREIKVVYIGPKITKH